MEATIQPTIQTVFPTRSTAERRAGVWAGRVATGLVAAFLAFDACIKLSGHPAVAAAGAKLGLPAHLHARLGVLLAVLLVLHLVRRTSVAGAILLTGYLGGAVLTHLRVGDPLFSHTFFPLYVGALLWGGLLLRDRRARALFTGRN